MHQLITDEKFTNVQRAQAGLSKIFDDAKKTRSFYRVLRNDEPLGVLVPQEMWEDFVEDLEAFASTKYARRIAASRKSKKRISAKELKVELGL